MKRPVMLLILFITSVLLADTTVVMDSTAVAFGTPEMFKKLLVDYQALLVFIGTIGGMITAYYVLLNKLVKSVRNLYNGITKFWNTWKPTLGGPMKKSFEENVIKPADEVTERTADIFQKLKLKKLETKLRDIIK